MNIQEVRVRLAAIEACKSEYDRPHELEDALMRDFITEVALRDDELGAVAREILRSKEIDFVRYYA